LGACFLVFIQICRPQGRRNVMPTRLTRAFCAALAALVLNPAPALLAQVPQTEPVEGEVGPVEIDGIEYDSWTDFFLSNEFRQGDHRCGTHMVSPGDVRVPADCNGSRTNPLPIYDPGPHYRIPVVVHVIHSGAAGNIPDARIATQITVLNQDYQALPGTPGAPATNVSIEF